MHERDIDKVLAQEPHLEFVGAQDIADDQIIGAIVANLRGTPRQVAGSAQ